MRRRIVVIVCLLWHSVLVLFAQPTQPILRIENGMHNAYANKISTDSAGKYVLSCSDDKTARLWDAETGKLLNTLRIPIGGTDEGEIYACAISPDGTIVALGGRTGEEWDTKYSIYIVNMPTGHIIHRAAINRLRATCINFEELKQTVSNIAGKVVVFIDACHSGNVMGNSERRGITDINAMVNELSSTQNGSVTFTSSTGKEFSLEDASWKHGAFTKALLEGLGGKAAVPGKNKITVKSLDVYIS